MLLHFNENVCTGAGGWKKTILHASHDKNVNKRVFSCVSELHCGDAGRLQTGRTIKSAKVEITRRAMALSVLPNAAAGLTHTHNTSCVAAPTNIKCNHF